jgi:SAM-dependent methyltransferase
MNKTPSISVKDLYKNEASHYEAFGSSSYGWLYIEEPAFDTYLKRLYSPEIKVLEIGSGAGRVIEYLITRGVKVENITGLDISHEMIEISKKRLPKAHFIEGNAAEKVLNEDTYDLIVSSMVFHHIDDDELKSTFKNAFQSLRVGGIFFYLTSHPLNIIQGKLELYFNRGWIDRKTPWGAIMPHYHRTVADFIKITRDVGFQIEAIDEPEVIKEGKVDPEKYYKYSVGPSRLVIVAKRIK